MKRHFWGGLVALAASAALATACSGAQGSPASSSGVELHFLNIAAVPASDSAGLYIAVQDGRIAAVGEVSGSAARTIDAGGQVTKDPAVELTLDMAAVMADKPG